MTTVYHMTADRARAAERTALATAAHEEAFHWFSAEYDAWDIAYRLYDRAYDAWVLACAIAGCDADTTARDAAWTEYQAAGDRMTEAHTAWLDAYDAHSAACADELALYGL